MAEPNTTNSIPATPPAGTGSSGPTPTELRDIRGPVEIPSPWEWLWFLLWAAVAALVVWALWKAWQYWKDRPADVRIAPAHETALAELEEALSLLNDPNAFCTRVSGILRRYLETRFDLHAPERTTEEFLRELRITRQVTPDQKETLARFLEQCDLVKFARLEPSQQELLDLHKNARRLIHETEPKEQDSSSSPKPPTAATLPGAQNDPKLESA